MSPTHIAESIVQRRQRDRLHGRLRLPGERRESAVFVLLLCFVGVLVLAGIALVVS